MRKYVRKTSKKVVAKRRYKKRVYRKRVYKARPRRAIPSMEKKEFTIATDGPVLFGQVSGNSSGHYENIVTPIPSIGSGHQQRIGKKISITSMFFQFQFFQQASCEHPTTFRIMLVQQLGEPNPNVSTIVPALLQPNQFILFSTIYDFHSLRQQKNFKNYKIILNKVVKMPADSSPSNQRVPKPVKIGRKFKYPLNITYDNDTNFVTNGTLHLILVSDSGNASGITASGIPSGVPIVGTNTGTVMNYIFKYWYYDS